MQVTLRLREFEGFVLRNRQYPELHKNKQYTIGGLLFATDITQALHYLNKIIAKNVTLEYENIPKIIEKMVDESIRV